MAAVTPGTNPLIITVNLLSWNFQGFTSAVCGSCGKTANAPCGNPGWECTCGHFNILPFSGAFIPHDNPDLGPTQKVIQGAVKIKAAKAPNWLTGKIMQGERL